MTYKAVVMNMVEVDSKDYILNLLKENHEEVFKCIMFMDAEVIQMENAGEEFLYRVQVKATNRYGHVLKLDVGGTIDDLFGILHSVVWDSKGNTIWYESKGTRETVGIKEFKIA